MEFKKPIRSPGRQPVRSVSTSNEAASPFRTQRQTSTVPPRPQVTPAPLADIPQSKPKQNLRTSLSGSAPVSYMRTFHFTKSNTLFTVGGGMIVIAIISAGTLIYQHNTAPTGDTNEFSNKVVHDLEYQTILPSGKSINDLGGWKRVSPAKSDPVFAYSDTINNISVSVSQQPLPASFVGDTDDEVAELAKKFNATTKIEADGIKLYVGSSAKGPQSAIFTKNSLLILIKSQEKIEDSAWAKYAKSLN